MWHKWLKISRFPLLSLCNWVHCCHTAISEEECHFNKSKFKSPIYQRHIKDTAMSAFWINLGFNHNDHGLMFFWWYQRQILIITFSSVRSTPSSSWAAAARTTSTVKSPSCSSCTSSCSSSTTIAARRGLLPSFTLWKIPWHEFWDSWVSWLNHSLSLSLEKWPEKLRRYAPTKGNQEKTGREKIEKERKKGENKRKRKSKEIKREKREKKGEKRARKERKGEKKREKREKKREQEREQK